VCAGLLGFAAYTGRYANREAFLYFLQTGEVFRYLIFQVISAIGYGAVTSAFVAFVVTGLRYMNCIHWTVYPVAAAVICSGLGVNEDYIFWQKVDVITFRSIVSSLFAWAIILIIKRFEKRKFPATP
jgi:hypothetical protein